MQKRLIIGYGNPDREDDGVAWHILQTLATHFNSSVLMSDGGTFEQTDNPQLVFTLQLTPEMAESLTEYDFVCFVDAHTGAYAEAVRVASLESGYQTSPFTHHLTPESCLGLAEALYGRRPEAIIVSVRGYEFGYRRDLSDKTARLVPTAVEEIAGRIERSE
jgi:hydrogenase maturation protease